MTLVMAAPDATNVRQFRTYKDLEVWRRAMLLVRHVYARTKSFPADERFGLVAQARRAAVSIPCNIAEGNGRSRRRDYIRLLLVARGSVQELETQLLIASDQKFLPSGESTELLRRTNEVGRLLAGLIRALTRIDNSPSTRPAPHVVRSPQSPAPRAQRLARK